MIERKAKEYLRAGLSVIPTKEDKRPALSSWKAYQAKAMTEEEVDISFTGYNVKGLAIICGAVSGNLEVIDVDTKHDTTGHLWGDLSSLMEDNLPDLYSNLVIAQTRSGGYHIYYRCSSIAGNLKLSIKKNREVLIETRGEGGYVIAPPSENYRYIQGTPGDIPTISPEEREIILSISRSFNELEEVRPEIKKASSPYRYTGLSPFDDYNQRGDVISLLEGNGWRIVNQRGQRINLLRPGSTDSKTSGNYHTGLRVLRVFSSSTEFNPDKAYSPSQVYSLLECNNDYRLTYRRLLELGYGEPYKGDSITNTQVKTERIKVEVINTATSESSVISTPGGSLKIETIKTATGQEAVITSPGDDALEETLKAIELLQEAGKRIYIKEGDTELREYNYQLRAIFNKYGAIQDQKGELGDRDRDNLLDEVVMISNNLQPIDRDLYLKDLLSMEAIQELGITEQSLQITTDRIASTKDREKQEEEFNSLLTQATKLREKGEIGKALELLSERAKKAKSLDKATEYNSLMIPISEAEIRKNLSGKPESLPSGYKIGGEDLLLPAGAISVISAPTSHGKTTFLINLLLNVAEADKDKDFYLFSYEEDRESILMTTLSTYLGEEISENNRRSIRSYFKTGSSEYVKAETREFFLTGKDRFFSEMISPGRVNIHYTNYDSDTLIEAIRHIHKTGNPGAIFIDYIQLLNLPTGKYKTYSRQEEIKQICIDLKDVAVETGLPIILGAQFNREVENHTKLLAQKIGEAGDIERIANLIVGFWNNNFAPITASKGEERDITSEAKNEPGTIYTTILKNRGGRVGLTENLLFDGNVAKITNKPSPSKLEQYFDEPK